MIRGLCLRSALAPAILLAPTFADAHAFGVRYDLPLPLGYFLVAAGMAVAVSFLAALIFLQRSSGSAIGLDIAIAPAIMSAARALLASFGLLGLVVVLVTAMFGPIEPTRNLATVTVWILWWVGFLLFSALVADLWPAIDPFRRSYLLVARLLRRDPERVPTSLPSAAGWLAPLGMLALGWLELVSGWSENPRALAVLVGLYLAVSVGAGLVFGVEWFRRADPLARIFALVSRVAPLTLVGSRGIRLRPWGEGLVDASPALPGNVALVACLMGAVLFDGLSETPAWAAVLDLVSESRALRPALLALRDQGLDLLAVLKTIGLVGTVIAIFGLYWFLAWGMRTCSGTALSTRSVGTALAGCLLPIVVAYHLAHYLSYLLLAGQLAAPAASDPFGLGWDLLRVAGRPIDIGVIGAKQVWWVAVAALVAGHSLSVLVGHRCALALFGSPWPAARSQAPMLMAMVGLTVLSLWILAQPIVA